MTKLFIGLFLLMVTANSFAYPAAPMSLTQAVQFIHDNSAGKLIAMSRPAQSGNFFIVTIDLGSDALSVASGSNIEIANAVCDLSKPWNAGPGNDSVNAFYCIAK